LYDLHKGNKEEFKLDYSMNKLAGLMESEIIAKEWNIIDFDFSLYLSVSI
jgi:hypothetical protein